MTNDECRALGIGTMPPCGGSGSKYYYYAFFSLRLFTFHFSLFTFHFSLFTFLGRVGAP